MCLMRSKNTVLNRILSAFKKRKLRKYNVDMVLNLIEYKSYQHIKRKV